MAEAVPQFVLALQVEGAIFKGVVEHLEEHRIDRVQHGVGGDVSGLIAGE